MPQHTRSGPEGLDRRPEAETGVTVRLFAGPLRRRHLGAVEAQFAVVAP
ncbi:hypothetical protein ACWERY_10140 [Streptomyces sp. NPDC004082]